MKRIVTFCLLCMISLTVMGQKASLNKAYNAYYEKNFVKAKEAIDLCIADEKLTEKPTTWLYKGNIYFYLANEEYNKKQQDKAYEVRFPDAAIDAYDAFKQAATMSRNVEAYEMLSPQEGIANLYILLFVRGVDYLVANDYEKAKTTLEKSIVGYESKTPQYPLKGELYYYYAYTLEMLNQAEAARTQYEKAIRDGSTNANVYLRLIEIYKKEENKDKVKEVIEQGRKVLPDDPNLMVAEADYYYWIGDDKAGDAVLNALPASVYNNPEAAVNIANFHIKKKEYSKAEKLLRKALLSYPDNYTISYNLGVCCYYLSEETYLKANEMEVAGKAKEAYPIKVQAENYAREAERHFNVALKQSPDDLNILYTLRAIYKRLESSEYDKIEKKIQTLENK